MPGIRDSFDSLRSLDGAEWGPGPSDAEVATLESALGCPLPDDYREFLLEFGWFEGPHVTVYGITTDEIQRGIGALHVMRWERA